MQIRHSLLPASVRINAYCCFCALKEAENSLNKDASAKLAVCVRTHVYMHACMHVCIHVCMYACMLTCMLVTIYVCMYVCICVCMYIII